MQHTASPYQRAGGVYVVTNVCLYWCSHLVALVAATGGDRCAEIPLWLASFRALACGESACGQVFVCGCLVYRGGSAATPSTRGSASAILLFSRLAAIVLAR